MNKIKNESNNPPPKNTRKELAHRVIVGGICIAIIAGLLPFAFSPLIAGVILVLFILLGMFAIKEFLQLCEKKALFPPKKTLMLAVALFLAASFLNTYVIGYPFLSHFILAFFIFCIFLVHFKKPSHSLLYISASTFGLIYIAVPIGLMIQILYQPYIIQDGRLWLIYLLVITKVTDIGAYFVGKKIGKTPLSALSPKKTVEGFVGGVITALLVSLVFWYALTNTQVTGSKMWTIHLGLFEAVFLGILLSVLGQLGDLSESLIKRDAKVTNSGNIPGLGGVLDLLDSLLFTSPALFFYLRFVNVF